MWTVKAEIENDYIRVEDFASKAEAEKYVDELIEQAIWDKVNLKKQESEA